MCVVFFLERKYGKYFRMLISGKYKDEKESCQILSVRQKLFWFREKNGCLLFWWRCCSVRILNI